MDEAQHAIVIVSETQVSIREQVEQVPLALHSTPNLHLASHDALLLDAEVDGSGRDAVGDGAEGAGCGLAAGLDLIEQLLPVGETAWLA